jgi:hypothetical protein
MAKYQHVRGRRRGAKREPDPAALERHVRDATYPVAHQTTGSWHDGFRNAFRHDQHRQAARAFARAYFARHGRLPSGEHHVVIAAKPGHGPGFEADITYPR